MGKEQKFCEKCKGGGSLYDVSSTEMKDLHVHICYDCYMSKDFWRWFERKRKKAYDEKGKAA